MLLSDKVENVYDRWLHQVGQGYTIFDFRVFTRELINLFPTLNENFDFFLSFFFSDTVKAGSVKLCMIITLLGVCIFTHP